MATRRAACPTMAASHPSAPSRGPPPARRAPVNCYGVVYAARTAARHPRLSIRPVSRSRCVRSRRLALAELLPGSNFTNPRHAGVGPSLRADARGRAATRAAPVRRCRPRSGVPRRQAPCQRTRTNPACHERRSSGSARTSRCHPPRATCEDLPSLDDQARSATVSTTSRMDHAG